MKIKQKNKIKNIGYDSLRKALESGLTKKQKKEYLQINWKKRDVRNYYDVMKDKYGRLYFSDHKEINYDNPKIRCCCCEPIRYEYQVINKSNNNIFSIGSSCINQFKIWKKQKEKLQGKLCKICKKGRLQKGTQIHIKCKNIADKKEEIYWEGWRKSLGLWYFKKM